MFVDNHAIDHVQSTHFISHLDPTMLDSGYTVWKLANLAKYHCSGDFILDDEACWAYLDHKKRDPKKKRKVITFAEDGKDPYDKAVNVDKDGCVIDCECVSKYDLSRCALTCVPIKSIDFIDLFRQI